MQKLLKYALILAIGFTLGSQLSKKASGISKIDIASLTKSTADKKLDEIFIEENKRMNKVRSDRVRPKTYVEADTAGPLVDLAAVSLHDLSLAISKKRAEYAKINIIKTTEENSDKKLENDLFYQNLSAVEQSSRWTASMQLRLAGDTIPVLMVMNYYNPKVSTDMSENLDINSLTDVNALCWFTKVYLDYKNKKLISSTSNCGRPYVKDGKYFMSIDFMEASSINDALYYLLIPFPGSNFPMEYLEAGQQIWKKSTEVSWVPISQQDTEKISADHSDYKWANEL